jgi:SAM-dependent methyltransferase
MDGDHLNLGETERALADLRRVNRLLLGYRPVVRAVLPWLLQGNGCEGRTPVLLDLGTGSGDVAAVVAERSRRRGRKVRVLGVDRKLRHLVVGRRRHPEQWRVVASADALPFAGGVVEWSFSSLFFHHFGAEANRRILCEMRRVTRRSVFIIDLRRSFLLRLLIRPLLWILGVGTVAREDGAVSVRHAWSPEQVRALLATQEHTSAPELRRQFPFRFSLILTLDRNPQTRQNAPPP